MDGRALETVEVVGEIWPLTDECVAIEPKELALRGPKANFVGLSSLLSS